jgi:uncharacterized protein (DUF1684 family)
MSELELVRLAKDEFFGQDPRSPLTADQRARFCGLEYFAENTKLRLQVVAQALPGDGPLQMQTSTRGGQAYARVGRFGFRVENQEAHLTIFEGPNALFMPFVDALAGEETYPAGRYLDPDPLPGGRYLVDFNLAYNPYCAYNEKWSCPLTPFENRIKVPIRAGEKIFRDPR